MLRKKSLQTLVVVAIAFVITAIGAFAWSTFTQSKVNLFSELTMPDTNLHDDFAGGPNKDIYVENSGLRPIYLRVRLTEYLQTDKRGTLVEGQLRDDDKAKWWAPHNGVGGSGVCALAAPNTAAPAWMGEGFHDYYRWVLGGGEGGNAAGQIYYKPATADQRGEYDFNGLMLREPVVVTDPLTETSAQKDAHLAYKEQMDALVAAGKTEEEAMTELGIAKTLPLADTAITMAEWLSGRGTEGDPGYRAPYSLGDYWVVDEDGWCYWANSLQTKTTTGLLLDRVERTDKKFDSSAEYCINAWLQATDAADLGQFEVAENGGITAGGKRLLQLAAGKATVGSGGELYAANGDGSFTQIQDKNGNDTASTAKPFVGLGVTESGESLGAAAPESSRVTIGSSVALTELAWNGTGYGNWDAIVTETNHNWYNLKPAEQAAAGDPVYTLLGSTVGQDGRIYLELQTAGTAKARSGIADSKERIYIGSVIKTADAYAQANPGAGPFALLYTAEDGQPGGGGDQLFENRVTVGEQHFYHIGSGVYFEVNEGETTPKNTPIKYYFARKMLSQTDLLGLTGTVEEKLTKLFPMQLAVGEKFNLTLALADGKLTVTEYKPDAAGQYTMPELTKEADGSVSLALGGEKGSIISGADSFLGNNGDALTTQKFITEPFLLAQGIAFSDQIAAGSTFTADGCDWLVLTVDQFGNRQITAKRSIHSQGEVSWVSSGTDSNYFGVNNSVRPIMQAYYDNSIPTLKPYVRGGTVPVESSTPFDGTTVNEQALSTCVYAVGGGTPVFPLSQSELNKYLPADNAALAAYRSIATRSYWLRTPAGDKVATVTSTGSVAAVTMSTAHCMRPSMWVRFSDADSITTAGGELLAQWKAGLPIGNTQPGYVFTSDSKPWVVLTTDKFGNKLVMRQEHNATFSAFHTSSNNAYQGSLLQTTLGKFYDGVMPALKPYVQDAATPVEAIAWSATMAVQDGALSSALATKSSPTAFVLSQSEFTKYGVAEKTPAYGYYSWFWTRTSATVGKVSCFNKITVTTNNYVENESTASVAYFPAAWIRLADADSIATATSNEFAAWRAGIPTNQEVGSTFTMDNVSWRIAKKDANRNLLLIANYGYFDMSPFSKAGLNNSYEGSQIQENLKQMYIKDISMLKKYALKANIPVAGITTAQNGVKAGSETKDILFIPSVQEYNDIALFPSVNYKARPVAATGKYTGAYATRTPDTTIAGNAYWMGSSGAMTSGMADSGNWKATLLPCMWVNFN